MEKRREKEREKGEIKRKKNLASATTNITGSLGGRYLGVVSSLPGDSPGNLPKEAVPKTESISEGMGAVPDHG